jgi:hypothetical protein
MLEHLSCSAAVDQFLQIGTVDGMEMLVGIVGGRLIFRMGRNRDLIGKAFPWLLECALDAEEVCNLTKALDGALQEAQSS